MNTSENKFQGLEELENRTFLSATSFAEFNTPSIDIGPTETISISDSVDSNSDTDYYSFVAPAKGKIYISVAGSGELDTMLELFNYKGKRIKKDNNISRRNTDSFLKRSVKAGKTYYIGVSSYKDRTMGDYELTVTSVPKDDYSSNPDLAKKVRVSKKGKGKKGGRVNYAGDVDALKITARRDGVMTARMLGRGKGTLDVCQVAVSNASGQILSESEGFATSGAEIKFEVTAGEVYYAYTSGDGVGKYRLYLTTSDEVLEPVPDTTVEPEVEIEVQPEEETNTNNDNQNNQDDSSTLVGVETLVAGAEITSGYYTINSENWFVVLGTDQSDHIELGYSAGSINVFDGTTVSAYDGDVQGVLVLGFVGDDYIRSDASLNVYTVLDGGADNDNIYKASMAAGELVGGAGNDMMVSIGGGADRLTGLTGDDSFWADSTDTIVDASTDEIKAKAVHVVTEFYQPYTSNSSSDYYVSLNIDGQNLADPVASSYSTGWSNFASSPLFVGEPHYSDIDQGSIGDCYFLAVLAGYAHDDPNVIRQMVTDLGDGTYAVRFFRNGQENYLRVDADLAVNGSKPTYAGLGDEGELWVAIAEKAYAYFRYGDNSYSSLNSGWMHTVYSEVSGNDSKLKWTSGMSTASMLAYVETRMAAGDTVSVGSVTGGNGPIAGGHAYAVLSIDYEGTQAYVTLYNPWGIDGRSYDSNYYDGELRITAEQFKSAFAAIAVSYA